MGNHNHDITKSSGAHRAGTRQVGGVLCPVAGREVKAGRMVENVSWWCGVPGPGCIHTLHRGGECSVPSVMLQHVEPVASYNHLVTALC